MDPEGKAAIDALSEVLDDKALRVDFADVFKVRDDYVQVVIGKRH